MNSERFIFLELELLIEVIKSKIIKPKVTKFQHKNTVFVNFIKRI